MFFRFNAAVLFAIAIFFASPANAQTPKPSLPAGVVATVNGKTITETDVKAAETEMTEALAGLPQAARRDQLIDYLVTMQLLSEEARKEKLDSGPDYDQRLEFVKDKMLMETLLRKRVEKEVTPEAINAFYQERLKSVKPEQEVRARHILVPTEEEAKKALAEVNSGKKFEDVATAMSKDPGSAKEGGDLGYFTKDRMVPEFSKAAFEGEVGKVLAAPVKSQFGWHVIKVEDKRQQKPPELASVEPQIRTFLVRKAQAEMVEKLRKDAKIEKIATAPAAVDSKAKEELKN